MRLAALSAGAEAPRHHFNGAVHSAFRHACNIRLEDGRLLALLAPRLGNEPYGVRVDVPTRFAFVDHVAAGEPVGCRADVLRVPGGLSIDLSTAQAWRGELPAAGVDLGVVPVAGAWRAAWRAWHRGRVRADRGDLALTGAVDRQGVRLADAARVLRLDRATRTFDRLIGCGPGLTPSGDDLIVGVLAGLWSTRSDAPARRRFLDGLCAALAAASAATGDISRACLAQACHGRFAEPLTTLVHHIAAGADRGTIESATAAALRVGHTSGGDGVFGLLLGLAAWGSKMATLRDLEIPAHG